MLLSDTGVLAIETNETFSVQFISKGTYERAFLFIIVQSGHTAYKHGLFPS